MRHPVNGNMVVSKEEIKKVTLEYCVKNLENGSIDPEVEKVIQIKKDLHDVRMELTKRGSEV